MNRITELVEYYGSDKNLSGYNEVYDELFNHLRDIQFDILEIGIGTLSGGISSMNKTQIKGYRQGASLRIWRDWFKYSTIWGMDIAEDCMFEEERIKTVLCDSTDKDKVKNVLGDKKFWIIIDDGWHDVEAQKRTFDNMWDRVEEGGIYVIEDIEMGLNSDIYRYIKEKELKLNHNNIGNILWINK